MTLTMDQAQKIIAQAIEAGTRLQTELQTAAELVPPEGKAWKQCCKAATTEIAKKAEARSRLVINQPSPTNNPIFKLFKSMDHLFPSSPEGESQSVPAVVNVKGRINAAAHCLYRKRYSNFAKKEDLYIADRLVRITEYINVLAPAMAHLRLLANKYGDLKILPHMLPAHQYANEDFGPQYVDIWKRILPEMLCELKLLEGYCALLPTDKDAPATKAAIPPAATKPAAGEGEPAAKRASDYLQASDRKTLVKYLEDNPTVDALDAWRDLALKRPLNAMRSDLKRTDEKALKIPAAVKKTILKMLDRGRKK